MAPMYLGRIARHTIFDISGFKSDRQPATNQSPVPNTYPRSKLNDSLQPDDTSTPNETVRNFSRLFL